MVFDTVVIDCEGCYGDILREIVTTPTIYQVSIEWDGEHMQDLLLEHGFE